MTNPPRCDRRSFITAATASLAAIASGWGPPDAAAAAQTAPRTTGGRDPDLIVVNAKVYTMDARMPRAEAFAVTAGRFRVTSSPASEGVALGQSSVSATGVSAPVASGAVGGDVPHAAAMAMAKVSAVAKTSARA